MRLSVLDQSPIPEGSTAGDALRNTIELAQLTDRLGYHRYWVAEHHGSPGLACNSPEVLIGPIAAATSRIRVGSGGVMLPHYSPVKVAESFGMLSALFPGRIDLGIGRAPGTTPKVAFALQRDRRQAAPDDFPEQLGELLSYRRQDEPELWLLGSSPQSAIWAAELDLPYCFADFINADGKAIVEAYRKGCVGTPRPAVAAWVICAGTDEEARDLSLSLRMMTFLLLRGCPIAVPSVERAREFMASESLPPEALPVSRRIIAGSPARVRLEIELLAEEYGTEDIFLVNILHDHAKRLRSYELVAQAFGSSGMLI